MSHNLLDRDEPVALYYQVAKILRSKILEGNYRPGDYFAIEQELQDSFQVSRATIRKALERLVQDGLIVRVTGKGIFVAPPKLRVVLPELLSFSEEMRKRGMIPGTRILDVEVTEAPELMCEEMSLSAGSEVLLIRRVRLGDGQPIVYSESFVSLGLGLTGTDDFTGSLYNLIADRTGRSVDAAKHTIEGTVLEGEVAQFLSVEDGFPGLRFNRVGYDGDGSPIVFETGVARADKYSYEIHLRRRPPG